MSRINVLDRDTNTLPAGLLSIVKSHLRIASALEDDYLKSAIARAIAWFETSTDTLVNPIELQWWPEQNDFCSGQVPIPETPVGEGWTVADGASVDMTVNYTLISKSTKGVGVYALSGSFVDNMSMTFFSGYESVGDIPAGVLNVILLYTGHLYENREVLVGGTGTTTPGWLTHVIAPWWKPSV